jgi:DNA-binding NarL/FixJ family response regulator
VIAKILLADDKELARAAIKLLLSDRTDLEICAEAVDGEEAVEKAKIECPDVAILDIAMPRMNGIQAAREILRFSPPTLILTDSLDDVQVLITVASESGAHILQVA